MKAKLFTLITTLLMVGCGSPNVDDPETLDKIIAEAISKDKLQLRGKEGEKLIYAPNKQTPYTGWLKEMYDDGQIKSLYQLKNGKDDGLATRWYENGQKKYEGNYKDGKQNGLDTWWHENGQKYKERNYKDGEKDGLMTLWYENGQKKYEGNWKVGKMNGLARGWYENGQKMEEVSWKDGKPMSAVVWKPNGEKCPVTNLKDGDGITVVYKDGTEEIRMTWKEGKLVED